jgi:hypothetical protein
MVQQINQQAKDGLCQLLGKTPEDRRPKMKVKAKDVEMAADATAKCCFYVKKKDTSKVLCKNLGHYAKKCP